ncbi:MAG TPA: serine hydrolase domain-containing protein [Rhodocyclaceae bacterium]|nr:serine hydrolase domain-containing protein [Rhodocyclaceae bacterium]
MTSARFLHHATSGATVAAVLFLSACGSAPQRPAQVAHGDFDSIKPYIAELARHEMSANNVIGMSIALVDDQRIVWAEGFGYADKEQNRKATPETIYRVGSISKLFTATAAMQLVEHGQLDLDRPLKDYVPEFSIRSRFAGGDAVTPRNLMTHHSGLPRDLAKGMFTGTPEPFTQVAQRLHDEDMAYPPNHTFSYSNVGISLLGHAIQNVTGKPFADYMHDSVLVPIGMNTAAFELGPAHSSLMSTAYRKGEPATELPLRDVPAGGLNASAIDLARFLSMVFADGRAGDKQVLRQESVAEMLRPQNANVPLDLNFRNGLGWMLSTLGTNTIEGAGPVAHHAGGMLYFRSQIYALPAHKLGVVVLANSGSATRAIDRIATETLALALEAKSGIRQPPREQVPAADPPWPAEQLQPYVGDYTTMVGLTRVRLDGTHLRAEAFGRSFDLVPGADGELRASYSILGFIRVDLGTLGAIGLSRRVVAGHDVLVARVGGQEMLVGERIVPPADLGQWRQRLGEWKITNLGDDHAFVDGAALVEEAGHLLVEFRMTDGPPTRVPIEIVSDSEAAVRGPLADGGSILRCEQAGSGETCTFEGYALQRATP